MERGDGAERLVFDYRVDLAEVLNLMDEGVRLAGLFDFLDVAPRPVTDWDREDYDVGTLELLAPTPPGWT